KEKLPRVAEAPRLVTERVVDLVGIPCRDLLPDAGNRGKVVLALAAPLPFGERPVFLLRQRQIGCGIHHAEKSETRERQRPGRLRYESGIERGRGLVSEKAGRKQPFFAHGALSLLEDGAHLRDIASHQQVER